jgi:hypothetical protein
MNTRRHNQLLTSCRSLRGFMLIDCIVYIFMFSLVTGLALTTFYRCFDQSRLVKRTADDITEAVTAGERWRDDLRQATAPVHFEDSTAGPVLVIPHAVGDTLGNVRYRFSDGAVWRQGADNSNWTRTMTRVKSSNMSPDNRHRVSAWRWELELQPRQKYPRTLPLFTFEAVPGPN